MKIKSEVNSPFAEGSSYPTDDPNWNSVVNWLHRPGVWIIVHLRLLCSITRQNLRPNERKGQLIAKQKKLSDQNRSVDFFFGEQNFFFFFCATRYALNCKKNETVTATFTYEQKNVRRYATDNFEFSKRPRHIKRRNRKTSVPTRNHPPNRSNFSSKKNSLKFPTNSTRSQNILIHLKKNPGRYEREQAAEFF